MKLADGRIVGLSDRTSPRRFRENVRASVCNRFTTVLGPGSDGYHEEHIHIDLAERRGGFKMCQWDVVDPLPEVPTPRPRPDFETVAEQNPAGRGRPGTSGSASQNSL